MWIISGSRLIELNFSFMALFCSPSHLCYCTCSMYFVAWSKTFCSSLMYVTFALNIIQNPILVNVIVMFYNPIREHFAPLWTDLVSLQLSILHVHQLMHAWRNSQISYVSWSTVVISSICNIEIVMILFSACHVIHYRYWHVNSNCVVIL